MKKTSNKTMIIAFVIIGAISIILLLAFSKTKAGIKNPDTPNDSPALDAPELYASLPSHGATYKTVKLDEVISYYDTEKNNYVRIQGIAVGAEHDDYGGSILLSDGADSYVFVIICHACIQYFTDIMPRLGKGTRIEVSGIASFPLLSESNLGERFNLTQKLPEEIGVIDINELRVIK